MEEDSQVPDPITPPNPPSAGRNGVACTIVHLSDLHFGPSFDAAQWLFVRQKVEASHPDVIVVSGDLVDTPWPNQLARARKELESLCRESKAKKLFVVPGNHDVGIKGNLRIGPWKSEFEKIFALNPTELDTAIGRDLAGEFAWPGRRVLGRLASFACRIGSLWKVPKATSAADGTELVAVELVTITNGATAREGGVLFATLDSNARGVWRELATGKVDEGELSRLATVLADRGQEHSLARIAILHHHPLPLTNPIVREKPTEYEPYQILRNAGNVLRVLYDHGFDLILHGHKHLHQFARVEFESSADGRRPMIVLGAGSAALARDDAVPNTINRVLVMANGQLRAEKLTYSATSLPLNWTPIFDESPEELKVRAFAYAWRQHAIRGDTLRWRYEIDQFGNLSVLHAAGNVGVGHTANVSHRPVYGVMMGYAQLRPRTVRLERAVGQQGFHIDHDRRSAEERVLFAVRLPQPITENSPPVDFQVSYEIANSMKMTGWEVAQRAKDEPGDEEWVGAYIRHPVRTLAIELFLPPDFEGVTPRVRCKSPPLVPVVETNAYHDIRCPHTAAYETDVVLSRFEQRHLERIGTRTWRFETKHPLLGFLYQVSWEIPEDRWGDTVGDVDQIIGDTRAAQRRLLQSAERLRRRDPADLTSNDLRTRLEAFARAVHENLRGQDAAEKWSLSILAYKAASVTLEVVASHRSWKSGETWHDFALGLGCVLEGAAFKQRRTLVGFRSYEFDQPDWRDHPDIEFDALVAFPVYHPAVMDMDRPPAAAVIGVVSFGSDSPSSLVRSLRGDLARQTEMRKLAQQFVTERMLGWRMPPPAGSRQ